MHSPLTDAWGQSRRETGYRVKLPLEKADPDDYAKPHVRRTHGANAMTTDQPRSKLLINSGAKYAPKEGASTSHEPFTTARQRHTRVEGW